MRHGCSARGGSAGTACAARCTRAGIAAAYSPCLQFAGCLRSQRATGCAKWAASGGRAPPCAPQRYCRTRRSRRTSSTRRRPTTATRCVAAVDPRLRLHNAVIALAHPSPPWPQPLADAGYRLARVEQPVGTAAGNVVVDLLFVAEARSAVLGIEMKDGSVQEEQARGYAA